MVAGIVGGEGGNSSFRNAPDSEVIVTPGDVLIEKTAELAKSATGSLVCPASLHSSGKPPDGTHALANALSEAVSSILTELTEPGIVNAKAKTF